VYVEGGFVANRPSDGVEAPQQRTLVDALVVTPPEGLDFGTPSPRSPSTACPGGAVPPAPFDDLSGAATHLSSIACSSWKGFASGTAPRIYDPTGLVSRAQMATFVERLLVAAGVGVPGDAPDAFDDDATSNHQQAINRLAAMGIINGVGAGRYDPQGVVTRAQMCTFLARALFIASGGSLPPPQHDYFSDDPIDVHQANINVVAEAGIAGGVGGTSFNPGGGVSRAQMATFLVRTLDAAVA
jgi:hypothetical protein